VIEDIVELRSVFALEEVLSLVEELLSVFDLLLVLERVGVSGDFKSVLSELSQEVSGFRVVLHEVNENPDSSLELVESSDSGEFF